MAWFSPYGFQIVYPTAKVSDEFAANPERFFEAAGLEWRQRSGDKLRRLQLGVMKFLLRVVFWLTVVALLLPFASDKPAQSSRAPVGPVEALGAAQAAVDDVRGFCARNPDACDVGAQTLQAVTQRLQEGAKMLNDLVAGRIEKNSRGPVEQPGRQTLKPQDFAPAWRGAEGSAPLPPRRPI